MRSSSSFRCVLFAVTFSLAFSFVATSVSAEAFRIRLTNGNEFVSRYGPVPAQYDSSKMLVMTDVGNVIALRKDDIESVQIDEEVRGFGRRIDTTTIEVGWGPNDAPVPGAEGEAGAAGAGGGAGQMPVARPVFNSPLIAEPNSGGGIPVSFANSGMVPIQ